MRAAPAVTVRCTGGWPWRLLRALLPALAAGSLAAWGLLHAERAPLAALPLALAVGLFAWWRAAPRAVVLRWNGQAWSADDNPGRLQLMLDPGPALLLRLWPEGGGAPRWVAVTAAEAGADWHGLRAAVYSRPSEATPRVHSPERAAD